jgi:hypothetical protein
MGQSFTAGLTGPLSRISVGITRSAAVQTITASIYASSDGVNTTGSALASKTVAASSVPSTPGGALTAFDFVSPVSVSAGTIYIIVLTTTDAYLWYRLEGNSYAGGRGIYQPNTSIVYPDLMFQTYVDI